MQCLFSQECTKNNITPILEYIDFLCQDNKDTIKPITIFLLQAEVGAGKTHLVSEYCKRLNIASSSPTFSFIHEYEDKIYHYDLYLKNTANTRMQLLESLSKEGMHFVEWGDEKLYTFLQSMGFQCVLLKISHCKHDSRFYEFLYSH